MCIKYDSETNGFLDITIGHKWDYISITRNYIEEFLTCNMLNNLEVSKIIISTSELLENAVKYSSKEGVRTKIKNNTIKNELELTVYNHLNKEESLKLIKYIEDINKIEDPLSFYLEKMRESAIRKKNGLGLLRIIYEGDAKLSAKYHEDITGAGTIGIKAVFKI